MKLNNLEVTNLNHASVLIKNSKIIYIDPYKLKSAIPKADIILITHSHYDHCSIEDLQKIAKDGTLVVCSADCQSKLSRINAKLQIINLEPNQETQVETSKTLPVFDGIQKSETKKISDRIKIKAFPAYNINKNFHGKAEYWNGYILNINGTKIYHAGDTDLIPEMSQLADYRLDLALLPVDGIYTMTAEEAMRAAVLIRAKFIMPIHPGNPEDPLRLQHLCDQEGINCVIERT